MEMMNLYFGIKICLAVIFAVIGLPMFTMPIWFPKVLKFRDRIKKRKS